jgi:hypothetical protein
MDLHEHNQFLHADSIHLTSSMTMLLTDKMSFRDPLQTSNWAFTIYKLTNMCGYICRISEPFDTNSGIPRAIARNGALALFAVTPHILPLGCLNEGVQPHWMKPATCSQALAYALALTGFLSFAKRCLLSLACRQKLSFAFSCSLTCRLSFFASKSVRLVT